MKFWKRKTEGLEFETWEDVFLFFTNLRYAILGFNYDNFSLLNQKERLKIKSIIKDYDDFLDRIQILGKHHNTSELNKIVQEANSLIKKHGFNNVFDFVIKYAPDSLTAKNRF